MSLWNLLLLAIPCFGTASVIIVGFLVPPLRLSVRVLAVLLEQRAEVFARHHSLSPSIDLSHILPFRAWSTTLLEISFAPLLHVIFHLESEAVDERLDKFSVRRRLFAVLSERSDLLLELCPIDSHADEQILMQRVGPLFETYFRKLGLHLSTAR